MAPQTNAPLGAALRHARQRLGMTLRQLSQRTGISVRLISELERGKTGVSWGRVERLAKAVGLSLEVRSLPAPLVDLERFPELRLLAWHQHRRFLEEPVAFELYEANWRFVDADRLEAHEAALIADLAQRYGRGVLNVST